MGFEAVRVGNLVREDKALEVGLCLLYLRSQISLGDIRTTRSFTPRTERITFEKHVFRDDLGQRTSGLLTCRWLLRTRSLQLTWEKVQDK
jgi:hypothetical protein